MILLCIPISTSSTILFPFLFSMKRQSRKPISEMTPTTHVKRILGILLFSTVGFTLSFTSSNVVHRPFPTTRLEAGLLTNPFNFFRRSKRNRTKGESSIDADIIVVGGGVSGLTAAITAAAEASKKKIILVEATPELGGRVQSESTSDGFILDKGFAVFIEQYPQAQKLLCPFQCQRQKQESICLCRCIKDVCRDDELL